MSSVEFTVPGYLRLFRKDSSLQIHGLGIYVRVHISLESELPLETLDYSNMGFQFLVVNSVSYLFFFYRFDFSWDSLLLDSISDTTEKALYLNTSSKSQELWNLQANVQPNSIICKKMNEMKLMLIGHASSSYRIIFEVPQGFIF